MQKQRKEAPKIMRIVALAVIAIILAGIGLGWIGDKHLTEK